MTHSLTTVTMVDDVTMENEVCRLLPESFGG
jgi:hypothetical protein